MCCFERFSMVESLLDHVSMSDDENLVQWYALNTFGFNGLTLDQGNQPCPWPSLTPVWSPRSSQPTSLDRPKSATLGSLLEVMRILVLFTSRCIKLGMGCKPCVDTPDLNEVICVCSKYYHSILTVVPLKHLMLLWENQSRIINKSIQFALKVV